MSPTTEGAREDVTDKPWVAVMVVVMVAVMVVVVLVMVVMVVVVQGAWCSGACCLVLSM